MQLGKVELFIVSDGQVYQDGGAAYGVVPRALWEKVETTDEANRVPAVLNSLLVVSQGKKILVDTGLGTKLTAKQERNFGRAGGSQLLKNLAHIGFAPEDIDIVVNTHLHLDHCGGNTRRVGGEIAATFPRAEYWMQRLELADATYPNERTQGTYFVENFQSLLGAHARILDGDARVTDEVRCIIARGHTRAHQCVVVESRGAKALFLGDSAARAVYMERLAWIPAYDVEPLETLETKRRLRAWAVEENALLIFQHDPRILMGRMKEDGDKWRVEQVQG